LEVNAMKPRLLAVLAAFVSLFPANGVFHTLVAARFFDRELGALAPAVLPMHDARPLAVAVLDLTLAALVVYVAGRGAPTPARGALGGLVVNLASSAAWNLGNAASFRSWPIAVIFLDVFWHCALGAFAGFVAAAVLRKAAGSAIPPPARG
jgi:uncharacterized membrane protein